MSLKQNHYPLLAETFYSKTLENGLEVVLLPKADYQETMGVIATKFGALDTVFKPKNRKLLRAFPSGIAHFLEHKLFEMADGSDAMVGFSEFGAETNAFTGYQQTVYYFSAASEALKALQLLQEFTSKASYTEASVEREKAIITQEIKMYQDDPDYQLYMSVLGQLYPNSPLAQDIAGTVDSIAEITAKTLTMNYDIFYQPSNMLLFLAGPFDVEETLLEIEGFQSSRRSRKRQDIVKQELQLHPVLPSTSFELDVAGPKLGVGLRSQNKLTIMSMFRYKLSVKLLFSVILGWTSSTYQEWYEKGKIDDSFQMEIEITNAYQFIILTMDTSEPIAMSNRLRQVIQKFETLPDLTAEHLQLVKNEMYGDFLKSMNSLEFISMQYVSGWINEEDIFELPQILDTITIEDLIVVGRDFIDQSQMTDVIIFPQ